MKNICHVEKHETMTVLLSTKFLCLMGVEYFGFIFLVGWFVCLDFFSFLVSFKDLILKAFPTSCSTPEFITLIGGLDSYSEISSS